MKALPTALLAHYGTRWHTLAQILKVTRADGAVRGYTSYDRQIVFGGITYEPGFNLSSLASTNTLSVDNMTLQVLPDGDTVLNAELLSGKWDNAFFELAEINYLNLADGSEYNLLKRGHLGELAFQSVHFETEFRSLSQALQQTQGIVTQKTCRARLGDAKCTKDLTAFTFTGTIDNSVSRWHWEDAARTEGTNYFAEGLMTITAAANADLVGFTRKVKSNTGTAFLLSLPMPFAMTAGDSYTIVAGCMKRLAEDCRDKFDNVINFQGEPHLPGLDNLTKPGAAPAQPAAEPTVPVEGDSSDGSGGGGE